MCYYILLLYFEKAILFFCCYLSLDWLYTNALEDKLQIRTEYTLDMSVYWP